VIYYQQNFYFFLSTSTFATDDMGKYSVILGKIYFLIYSAFLYLVEFSA